MANSILAIPNEFGVLDSLSNDGHTPDQSLCELVDNSIDAKANEIKIKTVYSQKQKNSKKIEINSITIIDNGIGITDPKLQQVLTLGARNKSTDNIGKYGFGLKSAAFNLADKITILSKVKHGDIIGVIWDRTDRSRENFEIPKLSEKEASVLYNKYSSFKTGTIIILEKIKSNVHFSFTSKKPEDELKIKLGQYYNKKINDGINLVFNDGVVNPVDILDLNRDVLLDCKLKSGIRVLAVEIHGNASEATRGIYVDFKDRIIGLAPLQDRKFRMDHAGFNYLRVLVSIPDWKSVEYYKGLSISNQKNGVRIEGDFLEEINSCLAPVIKKYKSSHKQELDEYSSSLENPVKFKSKKEASWNKLDEKLKITEGTIVSAEDIQEILSKENPKQIDKEPRTLCKFDSKEQLTPLLKEKDLCPIATKNGFYKFMKSPFIDLSPLDQSRVIDYDITNKDKENISLQFKDLTSERKVLNYIYNIGLLNYALNDKFNPTVGGLEFTQDAIEFLWHGKKESLDSIQIEVDGGFEGKNSVVLLESKMISAGDGLSSLNIRQIIFPQIRYNNKFGKLKPVVSYVCYYYSQLSIVRFVPIFIDAINGTYYADHENEKSYRLILKKQ